MLCNLLAFTEGVFRHALRRLLNGTAKQRMEAQVLSAPVPVGAPELCQGFNDLLGFIPALY